MGGSIVGKIFTVIATLIIFVVILYLAYITTKMLGKRYSLGNTGNKNLKIIDSMHIGQDKMLMIVKSGNKTVLIGVTKDHMEYICDVDESKLVFSTDTANENGVTDFAQILKKTAAEKFNFNKKSKENKNEKEN
ncbi:MAG: flagellar biosynthetic protein FliO [Oscillospiraceae bacterium]|nr:flagellar biosynthetic protein FliO [Oscillospiraceae bacterium]